MASAITKTQLADRIVAAKKALDALVAKNTSLRLKTGSTAMKIPLIETFQKLEGTLKVDGLYGVNTRTALMWYLQTYPKPQTFPAVNSSWAKQPVTWKAPQLEPATKAPSSAPTSTPVVIKQDSATTVVALTPLQKAKIALDEANAKSKAIFESNKLSEKQKADLLKKEEAKKKEAAKQKKKEEEKVAKAAKKKKEDAEKEAKARQEAEKVAKQKLADAAKNDKAPTTASDSAQASEKTSDSVAATTKTKKKKKSVKSTTESSESPSFFSTSTGKIVAGVGAALFVGGLAYYSNSGKTHTPVLRKAS